MEQKKSEFNKVLNAWDVLVIAFGAMIGWGWVVSTGGWIEKGGVLGAAIGFVIGGAHYRVLCKEVNNVPHDIFRGNDLRGADSSHASVRWRACIQLQGNGFDRFIHMYVDDYTWICQCGML